MIAGGTEAVITPLAVGRFLRHARALHPQRRAREGLPTLGRPAGRLRDGRGVRHRRPRGDGGGEAPRRADLRRGGGLRHERRRLPHLRPPSGRGRRGARDAGRAPRRRPRSRSRSTTSTPTAPRRRSATSPRCGRSRPSSASTPTSWRSPPRSPHRPPAGRRRRTRDRHPGARRARADPAADHQPREPGEGCDLDFVPNQARKVDLEYAASNSFGFGGTNASIILKRYSAGTLTPLSTLHPPSPGEEGERQARRCYPVLPGGAEISSSIFRPYGIRSSEATISKGTTP